MKKTLVQFVAILVVSLVCGAAYSFYLKSQESPSYLSWTIPEGRYRDGLVCKKPVEQTPGNKAPSKTDVVDSTGKVPGDDGTSTPPKQPEVERTDAGAEIIGVERAKELWGEGAIFVDARRTKDYVKGHIQGAWPISPWESTAEERASTLAEKAQVAHEEPVVVYCTRDPSCTDSKDTAEKLIVHGFTNVFVFRGGYGLWTDNNGAVTEGEEPGPRGGE